MSLTYRVLCRRADGAIEGWRRWGDHDFDSATHVQVFADHAPDPAAERWDRAQGLRPATAQELADAADATRDREAAAALDGAVLKTLRDLLLDIEQRLRAAGQASSIAEVAAATDAAEYTAALKALVKAKL